MAIGAGPRQARRGPGTLMTAALAVMIAACSSSPGSAVSNQPTSAPSGAPSDDSGGDPLGSTSGLTPGNWSGTITFHALLNTVKDDTSTGGTGAFQSTTTTHSVTQADATDVFTISAKDPADMSFGIDEVDLPALVANHGTTLERYVSDEDKFNALGCHWTDEVGSELSGPWTIDSHGHGSIHFQADGSYIITMGESGDPGTGEEPPTPQLPKRLWEHDTVIAGGANDCPTTLPDQQTTDGPVVEWASSIIGAYDQIQGKMDPGSPGSVVDGTISFKETLPEATLTVTWHLVHDGPITLPHN
jgi:hypothetical protein